MKKLIIITTLYLISQIKTQYFLHPQNNLQQDSTQMTSLTIQSKNTSNSEFCFGTPLNYFSFTLHSSSNDFSLSENNYPLLTIREQNQINILSKKLTLNETYINGNLKIKGINQWKLIYEENFDESIEGWSNKTVSKCNGITMLGGYCIFSKGETEKIYDKLPEHNMIRIQANFHFIDNWNGESGYLKIDNGKNGEMNFIWIESYSAFEGNFGVNVCGGKMPEGKFSSPIDVVVNHNSDSIKIAFGSNLEMDPCDESFGISGVRIFVR